MPGPLISLDELKTYLGLTSNADDELLASCASNASVTAERDTGRTFAVSSNTTRRYSTDGQTSLVIHDRPYTDTVRTVVLDGVTLTEGTDYWLLPDRRNPDVSTTIQLRYYDRSRGDWYKADPGWWDRNLDAARYWTGTPNDLVLTGVLGHPELPLDVKQAVTELAAWLYWRAKSGASGFIATPATGGETIELGDYPPGYRRFVATWRIRTAVAQP